MKKILLLLVVLCAVAFNTFAQMSKSDNVGKFSIGIDPGLPVGSASDVYNFALGIDLKYDIPIATSTFFNVSAGYTAMFTKSDLKAIGFKSTYGFIPVKVGLKYFVNEGFFVEGQIGATFSTESGGGTAFAYAPGIGYKFSDAVDAGIRYEGWSHDGSLSQIGLRIGFSF